MDRDLASAYARCRELQRRYGRTYFLATRLLPAWKRPHVHALYGFTRYTDELVDDTTSAPHADRARRLTEWTDRFLSALAGAPTDDPILRAVRHTIATFQLDHDDFARFLKSMAMDLEVRRYADYDELMSYMEGSAAVIGTMMLPILGAAEPDVARGPARELGVAFQLTNFIRDVAEDLGRDRIYLPLADLARFGVAEDDLRAAAQGRIKTPVRSLIAYEVRRARAHYAAAAPGIPMLDSSSQACIRAAYHLYAEILDEVERRDFDVFTRRAVVPRRRRLVVAMRSVLTPSGAPVRLPRPYPGSRDLRP